MAEKETNNASQEPDVPKAVLANTADQIRLRSDKFQQIYANNLAININSWDLGITFGHILGEKEGKPIIEETVRVLMTREIAKVLLNILAAHIAAFEQQFGVIKIPALDQPQGDTEEQMVKTVTETTKKAVRGRHRE